MEKTCIQSSAVESFVKKLDHLEKKNAENIRSLREELKIIETCAQSISEVDIECLTSTLKNMNPINAQNDNKNYGSPDLPKSMDINKRITRLEEIVTEILNLDFASVLTATQMPQNVIKFPPSIDIEKENKLNKMESDIKAMINDQDELKKQQDQLILTFEQGLQQQEAVGKQQFEEIMRQEKFREEFQNYFRNEHQNQNYLRSICSDANASIDQNGSNASHFNSTEYSARPQCIKIKTETEDRDSNSSAIENDSSVANQIVIDNQIRQINLKEDLTLSNLDEEGIIDPLDIFGTDTKVEKTIKNDILIGEQTNASKTDTQEGLLELDNAVQMNLNTSIELNVKSAYDQCCKNRFSASNSNQNISDTKLQNNILQNLQLAKQVDKYVKNLRSAEGDTGTDNSTYRSKKSVDDQKNHDFEREQSEKCRLSKRKTKNFHSETDESFNTKMKAKPRKRRKIEWERSRHSNRTSRHYSNRGIKNQASEFMAKSKSAHRESKGLPPIQPSCLSVCSTTIWIGHLSSKISRNNLFDIFGDFGKVTSVVIIKEKECAFVSMSRRTDSCKALRKLNRTKILGDDAKLDWAPGQGMRGKMIWRKFWNLLYGTFYIPYSKINKETDFAKMQAGSTFDTKSMPNWMKTKIGKEAPSREKKKEPNNRHLRPYR